MRNGYQAFFLKRDDSDILEDLRRCRIIGRYEYSLSCVHKTAQLIRICRLECLLRLESEFGEVKRMITKHVVVLPYDEHWARDFCEIKSEIQEALDQLALAIEHVGSTSVHGLSAKPIIDIDVVIKDYSMLDAVISALERIDYHHEGNLGIAGREAFKYEGKTHLRKHHLYVCPQDSEELKRHIAFREYLRSHPEAVREYSRIKEEGAALYPFDIEKYIEHKSPFVEKIYSEIGI